MSEPVPEPVVRRLARARLGGEPDRVRRHRGGHAALVFEVRVAGRDIVVKLYRGRERAGWFAVVAAMLESVRATGAPVPRVLDHGRTAAGYVFLAYEAVPGVCADACHGGERALWTQVGRHIAAANTLSAPGYGRPRFGDPSSPAYFASWREFIEPEIDRLTRPDLSAGFPAFDDDLRRRVRRRLLTLCDWEFEPRVVHANITGSNVIADPRTGELRGIIDWDGMLFARSPHFELATALLWMEDAAAEGFLAGYGLSGGQAAAMRDEVESARLFYLTGYLLWHLLCGNAALAGATRDEMRRIVGYTPAAEGAP